MSISICECGHKQEQHALYQRECDNCACGEFDLARVITEGDVYVTPNHTGYDEKGPAALPTIPDSGLKDSGKRLSFSSGMVRDVDDTKPSFDLIVPEGIPFNDLMLTRWAELLRKGAIKYARRNWEKADSIEELDRAKASAFRHFMQWFSGETDEDHAAAVFFNINEVETIKVKQQMKEVANGNSNK